MDQNVKIKSKNCPILPTDSIFFGIILIRDIEVSEAGLSWLYEVWYG